MALPIFVITPIRSISCHPSSIWDSLRLAKISMMPEEQAKDAR